MRCFYLAPEQDDFNQIPELQVCLAEALYDIESILADPSVYPEQELNQKNGVRLQKNRVRLDLLGQGQQGGGFPGKPKHNYCMARLSRYFVKNQPQHVIQRGNNRELIFAGNAD